MTITAFYEPAEAAINDAQLYPFDFPCVGADAIQVYEVNADGLGLRVRRQDYFISFGSDPLDPIKANGSVQFTRDHRASTATVRVERNTLITQLVDFPPKVGRFNEQMVEFTLDKMTMICQELAERKCIDPDLISYPISQEINFTAYDDMKASVINFALDKLTQIMLEIDAGGDEACRGSGVLSKGTPIV